MPSLRKGRYDVTIGRATTAAIASNRPAIAPAVVAIEMN